MANYTKKFQKPYTNGYKDRPDTSTPVTAKIKNAETEALLAIEEYLAKNNITSFSIDGLLNKGYSIAIVEIDGETYNLNIPELSYESAITGGTKIGKITLGDKSYDLYAPAGGSGSGSTVAVDTELSATSENPVQNKVVNAAIENKMDKSLETLIKYERGKTGTLAFTTTEEMTELIASYASIMNNNFALVFNLIKDCAQTQNYLSISSIDCDLLTDYKAIYFVNGSAETNNLPTGFGGGILLNSIAGSTSAANYQYAIDFTNGKQYFRKYYHGIWADWEETNSSSAGITIDSALSDTSVNPVQNKIITAKLNEVFRSVSNGKSLVASAITDKGITTAADATFQVMADNILKLISGSDSNNNLGGNNFKTGIEMSVVLNFKAATWNVTTDYNPSVSASFGESIVTNWEGGSNIGINIFTVYPIDLTNIKSIKIKYTESAHYGDTFPFWLGITSTKYMTVVDPRNTEFDKKISNTATGETEITMDVSDISGQKYIYIMPIGYTCTITDLILEKNVDTRFEIAQPTEKLIGSYYSTLIYTQAGANYYAVKATDNTSKYWAIGFITRWSNWYVPVIVSNTADYAHVISTNTGSLSGIYTFEYENKTYYCNNGMQGAYEWTNPITYKAIPLYDVADSNFSGINTEAAWIYMAKKLLDFYFGKEEFPH